MPPKNNPVLCDCAKCLAKTPSGKPQLVSQSDWYRHAQWRNQVSLFDNPMTAAAGQLPEATPSKNTQGVSASFPVAMYPEDHPLPRSPLASPSSSQQRNQGDHQLSPHGLTVSHTPLALSSSILSRNHTSAMSNRPLSQVIFQNPRGLRISGGNQIAAAPGSSVTINKASQASALDILSRVAAHTALHDSSARINAPRCHRNTRTTYLNAFEGWMLGIEGEYDSKRLIWLNGGAGAGKSAIMQSIIERCAHPVVLGSFFFSRTDPSRNYAEVLIPTLAYQLARGFPAAMTVLGPIIERDPLIFKASLRKQADELLIQPLRHLVETGVIDNTRPERSVFVIDGLDECNDREKQAHIIHAIATILCDDHVPVSFLIASRQETAISRAFQMEKRIHSVFSSITLDDNVEASSDIRQFVEDSFLDIRDTHPHRKHIPSNWPHPDSVDELVRKSSGHFVYVATAMKFISSSDEHPTRALQVVEGLVSSRIGNPFAELDALYLHILTSAKYSNQVLAILRHCVLTAMDNSVKAVCFMYPHFSPEDVELFLSDAHALVSLSPNDLNAEMWISLKHASLSDFLWDKNRSHGIYINTESYAAPHLRRYFQLLDESLDPNLLYGTPLLFMSDLHFAIAFSEDVALLQSLIHEYSPRYFWNFWRRFTGRYYLELPSWHTFETLGFPTRMISQYLQAIRDSNANHDNRLHIHYFKIFVQLLMEELTKVIKMKPHYRIIPAIMFSSSAFCLTSVAPHLVSCFSLEIGEGFEEFFADMRLDYSDVESVIDPRCYEAIRSLPESQISWGSDLAYTLQLVLEKLLGYTWTPESLCSDLHEQWLNQMGPFEHVSPGSPQLPSAIYSFISTLPPHTDIDDCVIPGFPKELVEEIADERDQCVTFLETIVHYLHKCDCTSELANLARRPLPNAALWFPQLMGAAGREMDAYVRRWDESPEGLFEKTQLLPINNMH